MRGEHQGKWYAEVYESTRHVGTETLSVHQFDTREERDEFIIDYNQILFTMGIKHHACTQWLPSHQST